METKTTTPKYKKQGITKTDNYNKSYYEVNKSKWLEYNEKQKSNFLDCEVCKCSVQYSHKNIHFKTKKHIKNMEIVEKMKFVETTDTNKNIEINNII